MFQSKINQYIDEKQLFGRRAKVLVALSGGADSVALLRVLLALGYRCEAAHCNFHLRAEESDRDEQFVRRLCENLSVKLHVVHFDTVAYAARNHISIEMAAREMRYEWFEKLRLEVGAEVIAVAHHRDDSVETFLLNLIRGTGINGLKGIAGKNGAIVRPLLEVSREEVVGYLQKLDQDYVVDSTNLQDEYLRNKIRLNLLPLLREFNPSVSESIAETAGRLKDAASLYNNAIDAARRRVTEKGHIHIERLLAEIAPESLLFEILYPLGFNSMQVKDIFHSLAGQSGRRFVSKDWEVLRDRTHLLLRARAPEEIPRLSVEIRDLTPDFVISRDKQVAYLDADKLVLPLTIRKWQAGDKFVPFGMKGKKKVSDYLTDCKRSLFEKENQYVACSGEEIVWLIGERSDNRFRVTEETRRVAELRLLADAEL